MTIAYGFYDIEHQKDRVRAIRKVAKTELNMTVITSNHDSMDAVARAVSDCRRGEPAVVIGAIGDLKSPIVDGTAIESGIWREGILGLLQDEGVGFCAIDLETISLNNWTALSSSRVIREYRHAREVIESQLSSRLSEVADNTGIKGARKYGRPPYGYQTKKGKLEKDRARVEAITLVFSRIREGTHSLRDILEEVKTVFPYVPGTKDSQFWDHVKLRRIISKSRLYCLGEYSNNDGTTTVIPDLAFLPPEWADTKWPSPSKTKPTQE